MTTQDATAEALTGAFELDDEPALPAGRGTWMLYLITTILAAGWAAMVLTEAGRVLG